MKMDMRRDSEAESETGRPQRGDGSSSLGRIWKRLSSIEEMGLVLAVVILVLAIGIPHPELFSPGSIKTLLRDASFTGLMVFGMVFMIAMVEIDLSVGGIYAVSATSAALLIKAGVDPWAAVGIALAIGAALGAINGLLTVLLDVPMIIVTLGTLSAFFGLNLIISRGHPIFGMPREHPFFAIFGGEFLGLPTPSWVLLASLVILHFVFLHTRFGATVRAIGANRQAAEFIGIRVGRTRILVTALVGLLCAISGCMTLAFFKAVDPSLGHSKELLVIAAAVIGGTSLAGGSGTLIGALLGVFVISLIGTGIVFYGIDPNYSGFVTGCVILGAIALDRILKRRKSARQNHESL